MTKRLPKYQIKLREWREKRFMTVRDLAAKSGCAMTTITRAEKGIPVSRQEVVKAFARALEITPEQLIAGPEQDKTAA